MYYSGFKQELTQPENLNSPSKQTIQIEPSNLLDSSGRVSHNIQQTVQLE